MWNSYFYELQIKYNMRVSRKKPLVIRFDGKNVTKDKSINLLDYYKGGFLDCLKQTAWYFSNKYKCYSFLGSDELSIIFEDPSMLLADLDSDSDNHANEITALLSQYVFDYFNSFYKGNKIFWHGKCFSIPTEKIVSYVKYRSRIIKNVMVTYFLIRKKAKLDRTSLDDKAKQCREFSDYGVLENVESGMLYYAGKRLDLSQFLKGDKVEISDMLIKEDSSSDTSSNDDFDIEFVDV